MHTSATPQVSAALSLVADPSPPEPREVFWSFVVIETKNRLGILLLGFVAAAFWVGMFSFSQRLAYAGYGLFSILPIAIWAVVALPYVGVQLITTAGLLIGPMHAARISTQLDRRLQRGGRLARISWYFAILSPLSPIAAALSLFATQKVGRRGSVRVVLTHVPQFRETDHPLTIASG